MYLEKEDKRLITMLEKALLAAQRGGCKHLPSGHKNFLSRSIEEYINVNYEEDLLTKDEACEELACGLSTLDKLIKASKLPSPVPLIKENQRVGIPRKYVNDIKKSFK